MLVSLDDVGQCTQFFSKANITHTGDEDRVEEVFSAAILVFNCINPPAGFFFYLGLQILRDETRPTGNSVCRTTSVHWRSFRSSVWWLIRKTIEPSDTEE